MQEMIIYLIIVYSLAVGIALGISIPECKDDYNSPLHKKIKEADMENFKGEE